MIRFVSIGFFSSNIKFYLPFACLLPNVPKKHNGIQRLLQFYIFIFYTLLATRKLIVSKISMISLYLSNYAIILSVKNCAFCLKKKKFFFVQISCFLSFFFFICSHRMRSFSSICAECP